MFENIDALQIRADVSANIALSHAMDGAIPLILGIGARQGAGIMVACPPEKKHAYLPAGKGVHPDFGSHARRRNDILHIHPGSHYFEGAVACVPFPTHLRRVVKWASGLTYGI